MVRVLYGLADARLWSKTALLLANLLALCLRTQGSFLFLTVHVLEIFSHSRVLRSVIQSVTYRGTALLQTAALMLLLVYFFGVLGFLAFPDVFQFAEPDLSGGRKIEPNNNEAQCTTIWKCFLVVLDMGIRKKDIGEAMDDLSFGAVTQSAAEEGGMSKQSDSSRIYYRILYTFLFFIIITVVLMNIIMGIIIDTFAELRAAKELVEKDMSGRCFVCGIDRHEFDEAGGDSSDGFRDHITKDHNMWKYIFFLVYLKERSYSNYSGAESYVFGKTLTLMRNPATHEILRDPETLVEMKEPKVPVDLSWFPQQNAMALTRRRKTADERLRERLEAVDRRAAGLTEGLRGGADRLQGLH